MYSISVLFLLHTMPWSKVVYQTFALRVQHSPVIARTLGLIQAHSRLDLKICLNITTLSLNNETIYQGEDG